MIADLPLKPRRSRKQSAAQTLRKSAERAAIDAALRAIEVAARCEKIRVVVDNGPVRLKSRDDDLGKFTL